MRSLVSITLLLALDLLVAHAGDEKTLLIDPFDGGGPKVGAEWQTYLDENNLGTKVNPFAIVKDGSPKGAKGHGHFSGHIGKDKEPWPWAVVDLSFGDNTIDLSAYTHLRFWTKGDGKKYRVRIGRDAIKDYAHYEFTFVAPKEWTLISAPLADFKQPAWGARVAAGFKDATMLGFCTPTTGNDEAFDLRFTGIKFVAMKAAKGK